jgi:two-component system response regulator DesR
MEGGARIIVVDQRDVVRAGLQVILGGEPWVARCAGRRSVRAAAVLARELAPHVAIVAVPPGDAAAPLAHAARTLRAATATTCAVLASGTLSTTEARRLGLDGWLSPTWDAALIAGAVRFALGGAVDAVAPLAAALSPRERDVLRELGRGGTNRDIAAALQLSPHTVKQHVSALCRKLGARNRAEAVRRARGWGLPPA